MSDAPRMSGIAPLGEIPWGTHVCHFYETAGEVLETIVPWFAAGLREGELCFWLLAEPLETSRAAAALREIVPDYERHVAGGALQIVAASEWYRGSNGTDHGRLTRTWNQKIDEALQRGFSGLRVGSCEGCAAERESFGGHEQALAAATNGRPMLALCAYPLGEIGARGILNAAHSHHRALVRRDGAWEVLDTPELRDAHEEIRRLNSELQQRVEERTAQLRARSRQQAALAALGQTAIRERDLSVLLKEVTQLAAHTLGTGRSIVWQLRPEQDDFILRAQTGWDELPPGSTIPNDPNTPSEFVVGNEMPMIVEDLRVSPMDRSWVLRDHRIVTMITSVVRAQQRPWGLLSIHSQALRSFTPDDVEFLQSMANVLSLAIERHEYEEAQRREHEKLQTIFEQSPLMLSLFDSEHRLVSANRVWEQTLGFTTIEAREGDFVAAMYPDPVHREKALAIIRDADGKWHDMQVTTPDGRVLETTWARFALSDGSSIGFGLDITERKLAEKAQAHAREVAEAALAKLSAIERITDAALDRMELDELLHEVLVRLQQSLGTNYAVVAILDEERQSFIVRAAAGFAVEEASGVRIPLESPVSGRIMAEVRAMAFEEIPPQTNDGWHSRDIGLRFQSAMGAPLVAQGKFIGTVVVTSEERRKFTEGELDLLRMVADRVAPAVERSRLVETIRAGSERLEALSRRLLTVQEEERRRLAAELHDELGQIYTAIKIKLGSVQRRLGDTAAAAELDEAIEIADVAVGTVRDLALDLRPAMLDDLGLAAALRWYADRFARQTGIEIHLALEDLPPLDPGVATVCFRVAQEALTNVARHAGAHNVSLEVSVAGDLELVVRDDGAGFDVKAASERAIRGASLGILGMEERVSLVSGQLRITSAPDTGTTISARIPLGVRA